MSVIVKLNYKNDWLSAEEIVERLHQTTVERDQYAEALDKIAEWDHTTENQTALAARDARTGYRKRETTLVEIMGGPNKGMSFTEEGKNYLLKQTVIHREWVGCDGNRVQMENIYQIVSIDDSNDQIRKVKFKFVEENK